MAPIQLVLLLSVGSFQAFMPGVTTANSPVFKDTAEGLQAFTTWAETTMGKPGFNQPPTQVCVVGAVPFGNQPPYIVRPIYESKMPVRALEPYSATFHYVEVPAGAKPPAHPRTMKEAVEICSKAPPVPARK